MTSYPSDLFLICVLKHYLLPLAVLSCLPMLQPLLSAILLGLVPTTADALPDAATLSRMTIAPPSIAFDIPEHLSASGVLILDRNTGQRLYAKGMKEQRAMASLTKLMTALIIAENHDLGEVVVIPQGIENTPGTLAYLSSGQRFTVGNLLSAVLISSANDAARTLAIYHSGSVQAFTQEMNERALKLGMKATSFRNAEGLDHPAHWSTAQDMAWLTDFVLRKPEIAKRMSTAGGYIASVDGAYSRQLYHTHMLLHRPMALVQTGGPGDTAMPRVKAGKTGTTSDAGECLVSVVTQGGHEYIVVLLGSLQRYQDMEMILTAMYAAAPADGAPSIATADEVAAQ